MTTIDTIVDDDRIVEVRIEMCHGYVSDPKNEVVENRNHAYLVQEFYESGKRNERVVPCSDELRAKIDGVRTMDTQADRKLLQRDTRRFYAYIRSALSSEVQRHYPDAAVTITGSSSLCNDCHDAHREVLKKPNA